MTDPLLGQQIEQLRKQLSTVDAQLAKGTAGEGLEDLKGAVDNLRPSCFPGCAADFDPDTPTLEPSCDFSVINVSEGWATTVPAC